MKIALIGYGKMGKEIEAIALKRGHSVPVKINSSNAPDAFSELKNCDVAIEFTKPEAAVQNIKSCFSQNIPVVAGTTGWYAHFDEIKKICTDTNQTLLHATNFSVGVNIFFEINKRLALLMNEQTDYDVTVEEIHHTQKLDAPSGTAITIAEGIIQHIDRKKSWKNGDAKESDQLNIFSQRLDTVPGTHIVTYSSDIDDIQISHVAHNRKGFATGAVLAAEFLKDKKGIYTMKDVLKLNN